VKHVLEKDAGLAGGSVFAAVPGAVNMPFPLRGAIRLLHALGHAVLAEVPLKNGRRADLLSLDASGAIAIVEVKSGLPDFRSDHKWRDYLAWCDRFYFAVGPDFPFEVLPEDAGLIVSDHHEGLMQRDCAPCPLAPARRRALLLRFAHLAASRLMQREDGLLPPV
jgi:hypothetical protein